MKSLKVLQISIYCAVIGYRSADMSTNILNGAKNRLVDNAEIYVDQNIVRG